MQVHHAALGSFEANCFYFQLGGHGYLVDPGDISVKNYFDKWGAVDFVLLTHGHVDHVLGVAEVKKRFPSCRVVLPRPDLAWYEKSELQASMFGLRYVPVPAPDVLLDAPCVFEGVEVLATPGHTPGGVCYHLQEAGVLFSGDTLFAGGVGRTDFPGGSWTQLENSIRDTIYKLAPSTIVYAGHGPDTTVLEEIRHNPFVPGRRP